MTETEFRHENLVIVGSGPVGMVAGLCLKPFFRKITLLERQSKENFLSRNGYSFPLLFPPASEAVLKQAGVWEDLIVGHCEYTGLTVYKTIMGKEYQFKSDMDPALRSHWRANLITALHKVLDRTEGMDIVWECNLQDIDFDNNECHEEKSGVLPFDLLIGADGMYSRTRRMLAKAHDMYKEDQFRLEHVRAWRAFNLPATDGIRKQYGEFKHSQHISFVLHKDNEEFEDIRIGHVMTYMDKPKPSFNVIVTCNEAMPFDLFKKLNKNFFSFSGMTDEEMDECMDNGISGKFEHIHNPTCYYKNVVLLGDSAHGFLSEGDALSVGIASVGAFYRKFAAASSVREALETYDAKTGTSLRLYSKWARDRANAEYRSELGLFAIGEKLGIVSKHPSMFGGIYSDTFDVDTCMTIYYADRKRLFAVMRVSIVVFVALCAYLVKIAFF